MPFNGVESIPAPSKADRHNEEIARLLILCAQKDKKAFRRLYDLEANRLYPVALRIIRNRTLADNILHDVMFHVWQHSGEFEPDQNAHAWLVSLIRRFALDIASQERYEEDSSELFNLVDPSVDPLEKMAMTQAGGRLRKCIERLQGKRTDLVVMAFIGGLTHAQVAARTGYQLGTVKSTIRRTLLALRTCLDGPS